MGLSTENKDSKSDPKLLRENLSIEIIESRLKPIHIEAELHKRLTIIARKRGLSASALAEIFIGMGVHGEELEVSREREAYLLLEAVLEKLVKDSR